jgi:glutathione S-transferase
MTIKIHHLLVSQSERVIWLAEELGLDYEIVAYHRDPETMLAPPELSEVNPLGQAPYLEDGKVRMGESAAIARYLLVTHGGGRLEVAPGKPNFPDYLSWFEHGNAGLMPAVLIPLLAKMTGATEMIAPGEARWRKQVDWVEKRLGETPYLAGDAFTAADIMCHFPFGTMASFGMTPVTSPNIRAWLARISERPAYQRGMKAAGHESDPAAPK